MTLTGPQLHRKLVGESPIKQLKSQKPLAMAAATVFGLRVGAAVVVYVTHIVLARVLEPGDFGLLVFAQSLLWIVAMLSTFGLAPASIRVIPEALTTGKMSDISGFVHVARRISLGASLLLMSVAIAVWFLAEPGNTRLAVLATLAVAIPFNGFIGINTSIARAFGWYLFAAIWGNALRPVLYFAAIVALYFSLSLPISPILVAAVLVGVIVILALLQYFSLRNRIRAQNLPAAHTQNLKAWIPMGLVMLVSAVYTGYYIDIHVVISGLFLSPDEMAIQNAVLRTLGVVGFAAVATNFVTAPKIAALYVAIDMDSLNRLARQTIGSILIVAIIGVCIILLCGKTVLAFFGAVYVTGFSSMCIASFAQIIATLAISITPLLTMTGAQKELIPGVFLSLLVELLATYLLVPKFGINGSSMAIVIAATTWCVWNGYVLRQHFLRTTRSAIR